MTTMTYAPVFTLSRNPAGRSTPRDTLRAIRRRMPMPIDARHFDGVTVRLAGFALALLPSAALSWMFIAR